MSEPIYGVADELVLSFVTLRNRDLVDRIEAASIAGFQGIGWRLEDFTEVQREGWSEEKLIKLVRSSKLGLPEIEFFREWVGLEHDSAYQEKEAHLFHIADQVAAHRMKVVVFAPEVSKEVITASFKALCQRAAPHNLIAQLEFMPYTPPVDSLQSTWNIVQAADEPNATLLIDTWQWARTKGSNEALRLVPPERITSLQLSDTLPTPMSDVAEESRHHRQIPGTGSLDFVSFLHTLTAYGVKAPLSVEVMSDKLDAKPTLQAAQEVAKGTRSVMWNALQESLRI